MKITRKSFRLSLIFIAIFIAILIFIVAKRLFINQNKFLSLSPSSKSQITKIQGQTYLAPQILTLEKTDQIIGPRQAPLKLFVYEDYTNLFSANLAQTLDKIRKKFPQQVAVVVRPYTKSSSLARSAAASVQCAGQQGQWLAMRSLLFKTVEQEKFLTENFQLDAQKLGLNLKSFNSCFLKVKKLGKLKTSGSQDVMKNIQGVPTMFIGQKIILGARPYNNYIDSHGDYIQGLESLVAEQLTKIK